MKESLKVGYFQCLTSSCSWSFWAFVLVEAPDSPDDNKVCRCHTGPVGAGPGSSYRCHSCRKTRHTVTNPQKTHGQESLNNKKPQQATQRVTSKVTASVKSIAAPAEFITGPSVGTISFWSTEEPITSTVLMLAIHMLSEVNSHLIVLHAYL